MAVATDGAGFIARFNVLEAAVGQCQTDIGKHLTELNNQRGMVEMIKLQQQADLAAVKAEISNMQTLINGEVDRVNRAMDSVPQAVKDVEAMKDQLNERIPAVEKDMDKFREWANQTVPNLGLINSLLSQRLPEVIKNLQDSSVTKKELSDFGAEQAKHFAGLVQSGGQVQSAVQDIEARLKKLENSDRPHGGVGSGGSRHVANSRVLGTIPTYTGTPKEYKNWAQKMRNVLSQTDKRFRQLIDWLDKQKTEPDEMELGDLMDNHLGCNSAEMEELTEQMWFLICIKTGTELLPTLNNLENDGKVSASCKGPSAWWRIRAYAIGANLSRVQALNGRVYGPDRVSSEEHLQYELDGWEADVCEYEIIQGRDVDELSKRGGLLQLIPKKMADAIEDNPMATTFEQARNYVRRQIDLKRAAWTRGGASKHQKPKDPNLGNLDGQAHQHYPPNEHYDQWGGHSDQEEGGEANGFKGGGAKGRFEGACDYCGRRNHRWRQCHKLSEDRYYGQEGQWHNPGFGGKSSPKGGDKGGKQGGKGTGDYYKGGESKGGKGYNGGWSNSGNNGGWNNNGKGKGDSLHLRRPLNPAGTPSPPPRG